MKEILKKYIASIPTDEFALFLSGGMDSILILCILKELGKKVSCYSFTREDRLSSDLTRGHQIAFHFGVPFYQITINLSNKDILIENIKTLKYKFGAKKKTEIECSYPFLMSAPFIKEQYIISGHAAEGNYCISKKGMLHFRDSQESLEKFRDQYYSKPTQYHILKPLFDSFGKTLIPYPFALPELREWFRGKTWEEVNKPNQKQPIIDALADYSLPFKMEKHSNLQLGDSGIAEGFNILLEGTEFKNPIAVYNRL